MIKTIKPLPLDTIKLNDEILIIMKRKVLQKGIVDKGFHFVSLCLHTKIQAQVLIITKNMQSRTFQKKIIAKYVGT